MTLLLVTESHGEIESGFYGPFTQFTRVGEYTFSTRHLCELIEYLADNSKIYQSQIFGFNLDQFWQKEQEYEGELFKMILEAEQSYLPELQRFHVGSRLEEQQGQISPEDEINLYTNGKKVPVRVANDERSIFIGDYLVSAPHFERMVIYLVNGGFMGWVDGHKPKFAEQTLEAVRKSKRELYKEIKIQSNHLN
ncbi:hypothetical protein HYW74_05095 [Candidatus Pacearchaeota archaeon]|nr:hypothetical protein [Candidatus Pacearchaeota archaeon]